MHDSNRPAANGGTLTPTSALPMAADAAAASAGPQTLRVEFTGSGSEYFRIWLVNLLLTVATLSLYYPFAKVRRLAYFHGNARVGEQPLGFHGNPWKMLPGHLLIVLFGFQYVISSRYSPTSAPLAIACFALLWPALWRASLQFRLGNTSWRGLRFGFDGSLRGAYLSMLPAVVPWVAIISIGPFVPQPEPGGEHVTAPGLRMGIAILVVVLLSLVAMPLALAWIKRYQHGHCVYAGQRSRLEAGAGAFYRYALQLLGVSLLVSLVAGLLLALAIASAGGKVGAGAFGAALAFYALFFAVLMPFGQCRLQNLVWGHTRMRELRCHSRLALRPLALLTLKNLVLTGLTLGLYWPFASVAISRMRLQAMSFELDGDMVHWNSGSCADAQDATGDFFGIDLGL
jgi:uncharacterized membrane protein YjgN (DUF898 family)